MHLDEKLTEEWHPWERAVVDEEEIWPLGLDGQQERRQWKRGDHVGSNVGDSVEQAYNWIGKDVWGCWCVREEASGCSETAANV